MKFSLLAVLTFLCFAVHAQNDAIPGSIYDFKIAALNGGTIDLSQYKGKKLLIVNTPEERDFAAQYAQLEELQKKYKDKLVVIGVIANDFQIEPGYRKNPNREKHYNVTFPLAKKMWTRGNEISPLYRWLSEKKYNGLQDQEVSWDFIKFLFNEQGKLVGVFDPMIRPGSQQIVAAIEK